MDHARLKRTLRNTRSHWYFQPPGASQKVVVTKGFVSDYGEMFLKDRPALYLNVLSQEFLQQRQHQSGPGHWVPIKVTFFHWTITGFRVDHDYEFWNNMFKTNRTMFRDYVQFLPQDTIAKLAVEHDSFGVNRPLADLLKGM